MDECKRSHVPAFGSWNCHDDLPFTQCFESARQAGLLRYSYSEGRDLYVAGDLYQNDVMTPAMIVVPRRTIRNCYSDDKEVKNQGWVCDVKEPPCPIPTPPRPAPKAIDEDLYKKESDGLLFKLPPSDLCSVKMEEATWDYRIHSYNIYIYICGKWAELYTWMVSEVHLKKRETVIIVTIIV